MSKIKVLDKHVAELIAAGEVVERPASVIKELVENSIDSGADKITVEISSGGIKYMRITDNGCGIPAEDVATAFLRHATSKVSTEDDLNRIGTLGFRGEALASIAAVARVEMLTGCSDGCGVLYTIEGGEEKGCEEAGCPRGTTVIIRDIFYNTPARMKFLKKDVTEGNTIAGIINRIALSHPEISFRFIRDGRQVVLTPGDGELKSAVYAVYGREFFNGLIPAQYSLNNISVKGFVCAPLSARASRNMQHFFINGRYIRSKTAMAALEQAYKNSIMVGKFPSCVLLITMPHDALDINVHPSKEEVRFANERNVFDAVYYCAKSALEQGDKRPQFDLGRAAKPAVNKTEGKQITIQGAFRTGQNENTKANTNSDANNLTMQRENIAKIVPQLMSIVDDVRADKLNMPVVRESSVSYGGATAIPSLSDDIKSNDEHTKEQDMPEAVRAESEPGHAKAIDDMAQSDRPEVRIIGEAFSVYVIAEMGDELIIIDKHAAHERMIFERIKDGGINSQLLISPHTAAMSAEECDAILNNADKLAAAGFEVEDFCGSVLVRAVPSMLVDENIDSLMSEIAAGFLNGGKKVEIGQLDWLYHNIACRAAVKSGTHSYNSELVSIVNEIAYADDVRYCPHGRPVAFRLSKKELEKQFGRQ